MVKDLMKKQKLRYYSSLSSLQKNKVRINLRIIKNDLEKLPYLLAYEILKTNSIENVIFENEKIDKMLKGQKMFLFNKNFYPLNIKELKN